MLPPPSPPLPILSYHTTHVQFMNREILKRQHKEQEQVQEELKALQSARRGGRLPPPSKLQPQQSVEKTLEDAFNRYEVLRLSPCP